MKKDVIFDVNTDIAGVKIITQKNVVPMLVAPWTELPDEAWKERRADMWLIYVACIRQKDEIQKSLLTREQVEECFPGMTSDEVFCIAAQNLKDLSRAKLKSIGEIIQMRIDIPMYVLIGDVPHFDAVALILDQEMQKKIASVSGMENGYYIIPSSIHECIVIPKEMSSDSVNDLNGMIRFVNSDTVSENERLSDHAYEIRDGALCTAEIEKSVPRDRKKTYEITVSDSTTYRIRAAKPEDAEEHAMEWFSQRTPDVCIKTVPADQDFDVEI